jgi:hypothetical protein
VTGLAADGNRVAFATDAGGGRFRVFVWEPVRGHVVPFASVARRDEAIWGVALAGSRVAWNEGGFEKRSLVSATLARRAPVTLATTADDHEVLNADGDGDLLAFTIDRCCPSGTHSSTVWRVSRRGRRCPIDSEVSRYPAGRCARVATADGYLAVSDVDAGRIAVGTDEGVQLLTAHGSVLLDLDVPGAGAGAGPDLSQNRFAMFARGRVVDVYDTGSGERIRSFPVPDGGRLEDLAGGIVVTRKLRTLTLGRVRDGRTVRIQVGGGGGLHVALEPAGLFVASGRRLTFTPMSEVRRLLGVRRR